MKKLKTMLTACLLLLLSGVSALAATDGGQILIRGFYGDVRLVLNGRLVSTPVAPFMAEGGHLMIPVRAVGEALGLLVEWDPEQMVVYLTQPEGQAPGQQPQHGPVYVEELPVLRNVGPFFRLDSRDITIASQSFRHGLIVEMVDAKGDKKGEEPGSYAETVIDLQGNYTWLEGYLGVDDETRNSWGGYRLELWGDGLPLYETRVIYPAEYPFKFKTGVKGINRLAVRIYWEVGVLGDYDRLWVALADLQVY